MTATQRYILPRSSSIGISWPALPPPPAAAMLAMIFQLEQSQWLPPEKILARQQSQLEQLLQYTSRHVPFYKERLQQAGYKKSAPFSWELFQHIPLLTRDELLSHGKAFASKALPKQHGKISEITTSGSTGKPVTLCGTDLTSFFWKVFTLREHLWHRRDFGKKSAAIRFVEDPKASRPEGLTIAGWGPSVDTTFEAKTCVVLDIRTDIASQTAWLVREQPTYLLTHPTNLFALADHFARSGEKLHNLVELRTLSETLSPEIRRVCREIFGVPVTDMYSTREVGYIALQCPDHEHYHIQSENVLVEVLGEKGESCGPGETGRVVVTSLHNFASPLIRYDIGDYAEVGEPCACGRTLPVLNRVMGRVRNMLTLPTGEKHWPVLIYKNYRQAAPVLQGQLIQHSLTEIEARFISERPLQPNEEEQLKKAVQETLGYPFVVSLTIVDEIPRIRGGKYEEFISHVQK